MLDRLEMVVGGQRQTALPTPPDLTSSASPCRGFLMERHRLSSFELPDHWIPFYLVGLQFVRKTGKRSFFDGGKQHEHRIENGDCVLTAPHEVRRFRIEGEIATATMVSIEPVVLQEMIAGSFSRNPSELIRTWNGQDPTLRLSGVQLRRAMEYIDECLDLNLTANGIAGVAGLSKYHFGKAFKQSTGMTLHSYVLARRMRRSQKLLVTSDLPLAAIAEAAGF